MKLSLFLLTNLLNFQNDSFSEVGLTKSLFGIKEKNFELQKNDTLKVFYPKNSYSPSKLPVGGLGFFASPDTIFLSEHIKLSYQLYFDETFDAVYGGKLPGLFLSRDKFETKGSSGGKSDSNSASIRLAWRKNLDAEVYVYLPKNQDPDYFSIPGYTYNGKYGESLWRSLLKFQKNNWNNITLEIKLNSFVENIPQKDGIMSITINDNSYSFNKIVFREKPEIMISALLFDTFFGGSTTKYATPNDTWTYFRDIFLEKLD